MPEYTRRFIDEMFCAGDELFSIQVTAIESTLPGVLSCSDVTHVEMCRSLYMYTGQLHGNFLVR